jgi:hypothetical protein
MNDSDLFLELPVRNAYGTNKVLMFFLFAFIPHVVYTLIMKTIEKVKCLKCGYEWLPREDRTPVKCPNCQCRKWESYGKNKVS